MKLETAMLHWMRDHPYLSFLCGLLICLIVLHVGGKKLVYKINSYCRKADFWLHRDEGGRLQGIFAVSGYSPFISLLAFFSLLIILFGPFGPFSKIVPLLVIGTALLACSDWFARRNTLHHFHSVVLCAAVVYVMCAAEGNVKQSSGEVYRHVFIIVFAVVVVMTYVASFLASHIFDDFKRKNRAAWSRNPSWLTEVELHVSAVQPTYDSREFLRSSVVSPLQNWFLVVFPSAVAVLLAPSPYVDPVGIVTACFFCGIVTLAGVHRRLHEALERTKRVFYRGPAFLASSAVILLAVCRWFEFSYIAVMLDSTTASTIVFFLFAVYVAIFYLEYWVGYYLSERLLALLDPDPNCYRCKLIRFDLKPECVGSGITIQDKDRVVKIHTTRFIAVGKYPDQRTQALADGWETYNRLKLFETIVDRLRLKGLATTVDFGLADLRQRVAAYFTLVYLFLVLSAVGSVLVLTRGEPVAELHAKKNSEGTFSLQRRLFPDPSNERPQRAIFVAASGGGTRAALYTAAVLQGLDEANALDDVVLFSGVSGGSAAVADYLMHRRLFANEFQSFHYDVWTARADVLGAPFIDDVLTGLPEIRMMGGTRMGTLLVESFDRRMSGDVVDKTQLKLKSYDDVGVIFNTTLAATGTADDGREGLKAADPRPAGARLVVTNLQGLELFPQRGFRGAETEYLPYVVVRDPEATLAAGAALSANFPPVFPNAAVNLTVDDQLVEQHWVTDGGASDNRGVISLLYALRYALRQEQRDRTALATQPPPPPIHIVIVDSSALSLDFEQDRGLGSTFGAAEKYANQVMQTLLEETQMLYQELGGAPDGFQVYYLPMPMVLRARGGVQTHWMLPAFITLVSPENRQEQVTLNGTQARDLILWLFRTDGEDLAKAEGATIEKAWRWVEGEGVPSPNKLHRDNWNRFLINLKKSD